MAIVVDEQRDRTAAAAPAANRVVEWTTALAAALQFLTIAPPLVRRPFTDTELGRSVGFFSLVGIFLGLTIAGVDSVCRLMLPSNVASVLVLSAWVLLAGALHLDGFLDTCDGFFGGRSPEARLRIMRDERVGAYAVIGGVLLMLLKFECLVSLAHPATALLVAPTIGRAAMALAIAAFPYARPEGLGRTMKDNSGWKEALLAIAVAAVVTVGIGRWLGFVALVFGVSLAVAGGRFVLRRLPGLTGDVYGALCELTEALVLLVFVVGDGTSG